MTSLVPILGVLALLATAKLDCHRLHVNNPRLKPILVFALSFFIVVLAAKPLLKSLGLVNNSETERLVNTLESKISSTREFPPNILILDGASYSEHGLNGDYLTKLLAEKGYPTLVLQVSLAGSDHFERYYMHRSLLSALNQNQRDVLKDKNCILMLEPCLEYDRNPLGFFKRDGMNPRSLTYLDPQVAFKALNVLISMKDDKKKDGNSELTPKMGREIVTCALANLFNVGLFDRLAPKKSLREKPGFTPLSTASPKFKFAGVRAAVNGLKSPQPVGQFPWLDEIWTKPLLQLYQGIYDKAGFYTPPVLWANAIHHARDVMKQYSQNKCILPDETIYSQLDRANLWFDPTHMRKEGADFFTRWMADQFIAKGLLVK